MENENGHLNVQPTQSGNLYQELEKVFPGLQGLNSDPYSVAG
jgi:hypothetical protein